MEAQAGDVVHTQELHLGIREEGRTIKLPLQETPFRSAPFSFSASFRVVRSGTDSPCLLLLQPLVLGDDSLQPHELHTQLFAQLHTTFHFRSVVVASSAANLKPQDFVFNL